MQTLNAAAERMFGYARDDVLGRDVRMLIPEPTARDAGTLTGYVPSPDARAAGARRAADGLRKDGTTLAIEVTIVALDVIGERQFASSSGPRHGRRLEAASPARLIDGPLATASPTTQQLLTSSALQRHHCSRAAAAASLRPTSPSPGRRAAATLTRQLLASYRRAALSPLCSSSRIVLNLESCSAPVGEDVSAACAGNPNRPSHGRPAQLGTGIVTLASCPRRHADRGQLLSRPRVRRRSTGSRRGCGLYDLLLTCPTQAWASRPTLSASCRSVLHDDRRLGSRRLVWHGHAVVAQVRTPLALEGVGSGSGSGVFAGRRTAIARPSRGTPLSGRNGGPGTKRSCRRGRRLPPAVNASSCRPRLHREPRDGLEALLRPTRPAPSSLLSLTWCC